MYILLLSYVNDLLSTAFPCYINIYIYIYILRVYGHLSGINYLHVLLPVRCGVTTIIQILTIFVFHGGKSSGDYGRHPIELMIV